jgi:uncharacterized delta-60 repeat protein
MACIGRVTRWIAAATVLVVGVLVPATANATPGEIVFTWDSARNGIVQRGGNVAVLTTSDNHILAVGTTFNGSVSVTRISAHGAIDHSWGDNGTVTFALPNEGIPNAAALQPDRKVVIAVSTPLGGHGLVLRLLATGARDAAFGTNGIASLGGAGHGEDLAAIAMAPDAKIVVAGISEGDAFLARLTTGGVLDGTFGSGGRVTSSFNS